MYANEETLNKCMEQMAEAMRGVYKIYETVYDNVHYVDDWWFDNSVYKRFAVNKDETDNTFHLDNTW